MRHQQNWKEAASCIRLAIAFDPWTDDYKEAFGEVQADLARVRADELIEEARGAWDDRHQKEALKLLEEAMDYRPSDAGIHEKAAECAMESGDLEKAREYAERMVELEPEVARYQLVLARVMRRSGLRQKAKKILERARMLDPSDPDIQEELRRLRQRPGRT
jgi:tetratricopeptide (TPR) repeat protein